MSYGIRKVWCWTFTQHTCTSFYLTSYVTDINYITHWRFFACLYQPIHWYLTRILTFLSEQWAPFSTMFASKAFHNVILSQHSNVQASIFVTCLNFIGTGSRLWQLYVTFVMTWYLAFSPPTILFYPGQWDSSSQCCSWSTLCNFCPGV